MTRQWWELYTISLCLLNCLHSPIISIVSLCLMTEAAGTNMAVLQLSLHREVWWWETFFSTKYKSKLLHLTVMTSSIFNLCSRRECSSNDFLIFNPPKLLMTFLPTLPKNWLKPKTEIFEEKYYFGDWIEYFFILAFNCIQVGPLRKLLVVPGIDVSTLTNMYGITVSD